MSTETRPVREKWKFNGRKMVDGVPHLSWKCEEVQGEGRGRHRAEVSAWQWEFPVDTFQKVTVGRATASH